MVKKPKLSLPSPGELETILPAEMLGELHERKSREAMAEPLRIVHTKLKKFFKGKCLDVGCDKGRHLDLMPEGSMGVDKRKSNRKDIIYCDLNKNKLPFKDETFDTVFCSHLIEHVHSPHLIMKEMHRVCKDTLIIGIPNPDYPWEDMYNPLDRPYHINIWNFQTFRKFTQIHGFKIKKFYRNHPTKNRAVGLLFNLPGMNYLGNDMWFVCKKIRYFYRRDEC